MINFFKNLFKVNRDEDAESAEIIDFPEDEPDGRNIAKLTIHLKDGNATIMTARSPDADWVLAAFDDFENWWADNKTPSYVFAYDTGKTMILRETIHKYIIEFNIVDSKPTKCPVVPIK